MSSIQTIDELIVTGRIIFPDNTSQDTSSSKILSRCSNIVRDENLKTTSILNDDFVINKSCQIGNEMRVPLVKSKAIALMDDLDDEGNPQIQTQSFTTAIKSKIETLKNAVDELIPAIIDPPNKRARLSIGEFSSNPDYSATLEGEALTISSPSETFQFTTLANNGVIDSNGPIVFRSGYNDRMTIRDDGVIDFTGGSTYQPTTGTFSANTFQGTSTNVQITSDNSNGTFFIPFVKTNGSGSKQLYIDDVTGPLTYNASQGLLSSPEIQTPILGNPTGNLSISAKTTNGNVTITGTSEIKLSSSKINFETPTVFGDGNDVKLRAQRGNLKITRYLTLNHPTYGPIYVPFMTQDPSQN